MKNSAEKFIQYQLFEPWMSPLWRRVSAPNRG